MKEKLDIKDGKGIWRNIKIITPLLIKLLFAKMFDPVCIYMSKGYYFYPIGNIFGYYNEETEIYTLGTFFWTFGCFRIVSSIIKIINKK